MRRVPALTEVSRREFCAFACGVALSGCFSDSGSGAVQTGSLDGSDGTSGPDASMVGMPDGGTHTDGGVAATCSGTYFDVGTPASFILNTPKQFGSPNYIYVVRDANGLYALTSKCTHQGVVTAPQGTEFHCNAHGANFTFNGVVTNGPANKPLQHYAMCTLASGNVGVQTSIKVDASTRLVA